MATGTIKKQLSYIPVQMANIGTTSIYSFARNTSNPQGLHFLYVQNSTDNPLTSTAAYAILDKPTDNGDYSTALVFGNGNIRISTQLGTSATAFTWKTVTVAS